MKGKLIAFASILCIASLIISSANAGKPDKPPGKPDKPDIPGNIKTELIVFTGELEGWAHVDGCCPNAGPNPLYTITLNAPLRVDSTIPTSMVVYPAGTYYGELFTSGGIVQFHACCDEIVSADECDPLLPQMQFGIRGGTESYDRKTRVRTVTFNEKWWANNDQNILYGPVSFTVIRIPIRYCTDDTCPPQP